MSKCVTHRTGCDCREANWQAALDKLLQDVAALKAAVVRLAAANRKLGAKNAKLREALEGLEPPPKSEKEIFPKLPELVKRAKKVDW